MENILLALACVLLIVLLVVVFCASCKTRLQVALRNAREVLHPTLDCLHRLFVWIGQNLPSREALATLSFNVAAAVLAFGTLPMFHLTGEQVAVISGTLVALANYLKNSTAVPIELTPYPPSTRWEDTRAAKISGAGARGPGAEEAAHDALPA